MEPMSERVETNPMSSDIARVVVYAAEAVVTMAPEASLRAEVDELASDLHGVCAMSLT